MVKRTKKSYTEIRLTTHAMSPLHNIQKVSLVFFAAIGFTHIVSGLFVANGYIIGTANTINQALDIPFIIAAMLYFYSSLKLGLLKVEKYPSALDTVFVILGFAVIITVIGINLFLPDLNQ